VSEQPEEVREADTGHGEHAEIHLPPNSFVPINVALSLCTVLVGFVDQVRGPLGPTIWLIGVVWLAVTCAVWVRAARREFADLPDSDGH
jgi:hypothetical protein